MADMPRGTVTFLFTDIEGSTRLLQRLGENYADLLAEHRRVLRAAFRAHGAHEVGTEGDALFVAFGRATDAVAAALEGQRGLALMRRVGAADVHVRMGLHTGEAVVRGGEYVGLSVHRAARICSAGHGGQVVISSATREVVADGLPSGVALRDLGVYRLKDLDLPDRLYQLVVEDLLADFPPLRAEAVRGLDAVPTNLPVPVTTLVGRHRELEEVGASLRSHRLLTLTGPGGTGKTRLALELAAASAPEFPDGVYWAPLQALRDARLVEPAISASIGAGAGLVEHVADKRLLVLVDNFEQVIDGATVVSTLLARTPNAKVLVTSREPLSIEGEQCHPVEPLADEDAATLFIERARAVAPAFRPAGAAVGEICRRLDNLPLAIELAAARTALLGADELVVRLDQRLPLLASRSRDAPERQRTLRATIEWSYELLTSDERELFRRLAVFRGSFSLAAAETVCGADVEVLEGLVIKSLVRHVRNGRLGMLDTIREYALEQFDRSSEAEHMRRRHADFFLWLAKDANLDAGKLDVHKPLRHDVAIAEQDNMRAALSWALAGGSVESGLELATALDWFWETNDPREGIRWFGALLEHPHAAAVSPAIRADALRAYGGSTVLAGDYAKAERLYEQSLALYERLGDDHGRATLLHRLAHSAMRRGALEQARTLVEESHALHEDNPDSGARTWGLALTTGTLGALARDTGDEHGAFKLMRESAVLARRVGVLYWEAIALAELAQLALNADRLDDGEEHARTALALAEQVRYRAGCVFAVGLLARVAAERGDPEFAGRLWGAIEAHDAGAPLGGWRRHRDAIEVAIQRTAGPEFEDARARGARLTLDDAVALALTVAP